MNFSPIRRLSRRHFMSAAGAAGLGAFGVPPVFQQALAASDATTDAADRAALDREGRILVVVELTGG
ncbi:MAG: twin-arginine translocation signal domain-containing protein, partial [Rhodospirillales bacterium]|nr:twin-arginine translocation signal domain-containing protein [Rhodospirillales bacterium]